MLADDPDQYPTLRMRGVVVDLEFAFLNGGIAGFGIVELLAEDGKERLLELEPAPRWYVVEEWCTLAWSRQANLPP